MKLMKLMNLGGGPAINHGGGAEINYGGGPV